MKKVVTGAVLVGLFSTVVLSAPAGESAWRTYSVQPLVTGHRHATFVLWPSGSLIFSAPDDEEEPRAIHHVPPRLFGPPCLEEGGIFFDASSEEWSTRAGRVILPELLGELVVHHHAAAAAGAEPDIESRWTAPGILSVLATPEHQKTIEALLKSLGPFDGPAFRVE